MKNNKEYSKKLQKFYRELKRDHAKVEKVFFEEPLEAIVYAMVSENVTIIETRSATRRLDDYFVDVNELRVSRSGEIAEVLGYGTSKARDTARTLTTVLRAVFNQSNAISLKDLRKMGKRQARKKLEQIDGITNFAVDYCMLTSLKGHAMPLTGKMVEYLQSNDLVDPKADKKDIEGFLSKQVRADRALEFYTLLRATSEAAKRVKRAAKKSTGTKKAKRQNKKKKTKNRK